MGRGDNRRTWKMRRKKRQTKLKTRTKRKIEAAKSAKKPAAPAKKKYASGQEPDDARANTQRDDADRDADAHQRCRRGHVRRHHDAVDRCVRRRRSDATRAGRRAVRSDRPARLLVARAGRRDGRAAGAGQLHVEDLDGGRLPRRDRGHAHGDPPLRHEGVPDVRRGRRQGPAAPDRADRAGERRRRAAPQRCRAAARRAPQGGREAVVKLDRSSWRRLLITGGDRVRFLQGLTTINVEKLGDGEHAWGAILNPKGRVLSVIALARFGETFAVLTEPSLGDKTRALLERYAVMDDVEFAPAEGPVHQVIEAPDDFWHAKLEHGAGDVAETDPAAERLRIRAGFLRYGADVDEDHFPFETPLVRFLDYSKGCYVGQEPVFRVHAQGNSARAARVRRAGRRRS